MSLNLLSEANRLLEPLSNELGLHWAQNDAHRGFVRDMNDGHRRIYADMAMGTGKTAVELSYLEACFRAGVGIRGMIWTSGADDVVNILQNEAPIWAPELHKSGQLSAFLPSKAANASPFSVGTYSGVISAIKQGSFQKPHVGFADEGQNVLSELRRGVLSGLGDDIIIPALTATPAYSIRKNLDSAGYKRSYHLPFEVAVANSLLSSYRNIVLEIDDVDKAIDHIGMTKGDYDEKQIERLMRRRHVMDSVMDHIETWVDPNTGQTFFDRKGMFSCVSIPHAVYVAKQMNKRFSSMLPRGMNFCEPIWSTSKFEGSMSRDDRDGVIKRHRNRETLFLATKDLLLTGHNDREIDTMFNLRPTASMVLAPQRGGRPVRYNPNNPDKEAHIIDTVLESDRGNQILFADYAGSGFMETDERKERRREQEAEQRKKPNRVSVEGKKPIASVPYKVYYDMREVRSFIVTKERRDAIAKRPWLAKVVPSLLDTLIKKGIPNEAALVKAVGEFSIQMGWDEDAAKSRGKYGNLSKGAILNALKGGCISERQKENKAHHEAVSKKWRGAQKRLGNAQNKGQDWKIAEIEKEILALEEDLRLPLAHTYTLAEVAISAVLGGHAAKLFGDIKTPESKAQEFRKEVDVSIGEEVTYIPEGQRALRSRPKGEDKYEPDYLFSDDATVASEMSGIDHTQAHFTKLFAEAISEGLRDLDMENPILPDLTAKEQEALVRGVIDEILHTKNIDGRVEGIRHKDETNIRRHHQRELKKGFGAFGLLYEEHDDLEISSATLDAPEVREAIINGFSFNGNASTTPMHANFVEIPEEAIDALSRKELSEAVTRTLSSLTPREERVLRSRFGVGCDEKTLEEVGQDFSVSRERIRQIESKGLRKLKHPARSRKLGLFLE